MTQILPHICEVAYIKKARFFLPILKHSYNVSFSMKNCMEISVKNKIIDPPYD